MSYKETLRVVKVYRSEGLEGFLRNIFGPTDDATLNLLINNFNEACLSLDEYIQETYIKEDE